MENKDTRKELVVSALENGTVIDHIPPKSVLQVFKILDLEKHMDQVLFGINLESRRLGKKGLAKNAYDTFAREYKNLLGSDYPVSFNNLPGLKN